MEKGKSIKADFALRKRIVLEVEKHLPLHVASLKFGAALTARVLGHLLLGCATPTGLLYVFPPNILYYFVDTLALELYVSLIAQVSVHAYFGEYVYLFQ